jgi:alcohol dehydrogenase
MIMKAAQITDYGGEEVVTINKDMPRSAPSEGKVLVEVYAAGVNPMDWKIRDGLTKSWLKLNFPAILGLDFSGVVAEIGQGATNFRKGNQVYGEARISTGGSFAEYVIADAGSVAVMPKGTSYVEAASLPLAGVSAYQAIIELLNLSRDQKILIHGGAGGIGSIAVQLAKHVGAYVATTVRGNDVKFAKELGADLVIDFEKTPFETQIHDYDAVLDAVGGETYVRSYLVLKVGGTIVSMNEPPRSDLMREYNVKAILETTNVNAERLARLAEYVVAGAVKPQVDRVFPLERTARALTYLKEGHPQGKVVIEVKEKVPAGAKR